MQVAVYFVVFVLPVLTSLRRTGTDLFPNVAVVPAGYASKTRIFGSRDEADLYQAVLQDELREGLLPTVDGEPDFGADPRDYCAALAPAYLNGGDFID